MHFNIIISLLSARSVSFNCNHYMPCKNIDTIFEPLRKLLRLLFLAVSGRHSNTLKTDGYFHLKNVIQPWTGWQGWLGIVLNTKRLPVQFPVSTHVDGWGSSPGRGCTEGYSSILLLHTCFSLCPSPPPPSFLSPKTNLKVDCCFLMLIVLIQGKGRGRVSECTCIYMKEK